MTEEPPEPEILPLNRGPAIEPPVTGSTIVRPAGTGMGATGLPTVTLAVKAWVRIGVAVVFWARAERVREARARRVERVVVGCMMG